MVAIGALNGLLGLVAWATHSVATSLGLVGLAY